MTSPPASIPADILNQNQRLVGIPNDSIKSIDALVILAEETKNGRLFEMELPKETVELLEIYLNRYRTRGTGWCRCLDVPERGGPAPPIID